MSNLSDAWEEFLSTAGGAIAELAKTIFNEAKSEAEEDAKELLAFSKAKLPKWSEALAKGLIDRDEFSLLVKGLVARAELNALKAKGLARQRLERFREGLVSIILRTVSGMIGV